jgi:hypothetical protein
MSETMRHKYTAIFAALFCLLTLPSLSSKCLAADQYVSGISGRVTTLDGSIVTGVEIQVFQGKKKLDIKAMTDRKGEYSIELKPGIYNFMVEWPSWKPAKRKNMNVGKDGKLTIDFVLQPGKIIVADQNHP